MNAASSISPATAAATWKKPGHLTPQSRRRAVWTARSLTHSTWTWVSHPIAAHTIAASGRNRSADDACRPTCSRNNPVAAQSAKIQYALANSCCAASDFAAVISLARARATMSAAATTASRGSPSDPQPASRSARVHAFAFPVGATATAARRVSPSSTAATPSNANTRCASGAPACAWYLPETYRHAHSRAIECVPAEPMP